MLTQIKGPGHHFNPYYQNNAILIQFIIAEFLSTCTLTCQIKNLAADLFLSKSTPQESIKELSYRFSQLLGHASNLEHIPLSRWNKGPLTKLKNYCEQFAKNSISHRRPTLNLFRYVNQTWACALHNLELLTLLQDVTICPLNTSVLLPMKRALNHLDIRLNKISKQILRVLNSYCDDENVLLFLLKKKEHMSEIYGTDFINKIFKIFPFSVNLSQLIVNRYVKRGFEHLLPLIYQSVVNPTKEQLVYE